MWMIKYDQMWHMDLKVYNYSYMLLLLQRQKNKDKSEMWSPCAVMTSQWWNGLSSCLMSTQFPDSQRPAQWGSWSEGIMVAELLYICPSNQKYDVWRQATRSPPTHPAHPSVSLSLSNCLLHSVCLSIMCLHVGRVSDRAVIGSLQPCHLTVVFSWERGGQQRKTRFTSPREGQSVNHALSPIGCGQGWALTCGRGRQKDADRFFSPTADIFISNSEESHSLKIHAK